MTVRLMSDGELSRLEVLRDLDQKRLTTVAAGQLLGLERRQVFRLLKAYRADAATGSISKRRGRRSNRRKPEALRRAVLAMIGEWRERRCSTVVFIDCGQSYLARDACKLCIDPRV